MGYIWDTFETYRLTQGALEGYLMRKFGPYDFFVRVKGSQYWFWIPRSLTQEERKELCSYRDADGYSRTRDTDPPGGSSFSTLTQSIHIPHILHQHKIASGRTAEIYKIEVLENSLSWNPNKQPKADPHSSQRTIPLVLKEYSTKGSEEYFKREVRAYAMVQDQESSESAESYVIQFWGSYKQNSTYSILLEYANGGNLEDYFSYTQPPSNTDELLEFWQSLFKLLKGLQKIHGIHGRSARFTGYHQDVKPSNILIFGNTTDSAYNCTFKLSDLGASFFARSANGTTEDKHFIGIQTYAAPECYRGDDIHSNGLAITGSADIWSLGCVYSEAVVWSALGLDGLEYYRRLRLAESDKMEGYPSGRFHNGWEAINAVKGMHTFIRNSIRSWDYVTDKVISVVECMLLAQPQLRPPAGTLWGSATVALQEAQDLAQDGLKRRSREPNSPAIGESIVPTYAKLPSLSSNVVVSDIRYSEDKFADLFVLDDDLHHLCAESLENQGISRTLFEMNIQSLLVQLARNLKKEANTPEKRATAHFISSRSKGIAKKIWCRVFNPLSSQRIGLLGAFNNVSPDDYWSKVNGYLETLSSEQNVEILDFHVNERWKDSPDDSLDEGIAEDEEIGPLADLRHVENFITGGAAFACLREDLRKNIVKHILSNWLSGKRSHHHPEFSVATVSKSERVISQLDYFPLHHIRIELQDRNSAINTLKGIVEDKLGETWNWWPLKPRMQKLREGQVRVYWLCGCGEELWEEVPKEFGRRLLRASKVVYRTTPAQGVDAARSTRTPNPIPLSSSGRAPVESLRGGRGVSASIPTNHRSTNLPRFQSHSPSRSRLQSPSRAGSNPLPQSRHVFFIVPSGKKIGDDHYLAQREVQDIDTVEFFNWLRKEYFRLAGFLRAHIGLREFSHCDFYKFRKTEENGYSPLGEDYPGESENQYYYDPRPMRPIPPIDSHEFNRRFNACYTPRPHLHWFHKCKSPCKSREVLELFPQRYTKLEAGDQREEFWGVYAIERYSFFRVLVYTILCILPCIIFLFLWLFPWKHPGDLQNASVPVTITITGLAMFWGFLIFDSEKFRK